MDCDVWWSFHSMTEGHFEAYSISFPSSYDVHGVSLPESLGAVTVNVKRLLKECFSSVSVLTSLALTFAFGCWLGWLRLRWLCFFASPRQELLSGPWVPAVSPVSPWNFRSPLMASIVHAGFSLALVLWFAPPFLYPFSMLRSRVLPKGLSSFLLQSKVFTWWLCLHAFVALSPPSCFCMFNLFVLH